MKVFTKIPIVCWELDNSFFNLVSNNIKLFGVYSTNRFFSKNKSVAINIFVNQKKITFSVSNIDDIIALYEIFILESYKASDSAKTIIDLGANVGIASLYFASKYPYAKIYAFEPNPEVFTILSKNMSEFDNVKTYPFLISGVTIENKSFFVSKKRTHSSSLLDRGEEFVEYGIRSFKLTDLMRFLQLQKLDLLKFDIEGAEFDLFKDLNEVKIKEFIGEVHMDLAPEGTELESFGLENKYNIKTTGSGRRFNVCGVSKN